MNDNVTINDNVIEIDNYVLLGLIRILETKSYS
jgi:hypothetical protein